MVIDLQTDKVLYSSNPDVIVPIASVTKLMTAMVVLMPNNRWTKSYRSISPRPRK